MHGKVTRRIDTLEAGVLEKRLAFACGDIDPHDVEQLVITRIDAEEHLVWKTPGSLLHEE